MHPNMVYGDHRLLGVLDSVEQLFSVHAPDPASFSVVGREAGRDDPTPQLCLYTLEHLLGQSWLPPPSYPPSWRLSIPSALVIVKGGCIVFNLRIPNC